MKTLEKIVTTIGMVALPFLPMACADEDKRCSDEPGIEIPEHSQEPICELIIDEIVQYDIDIFVTGTDYGKKAEIVAVRLLEGFGPFEDGFYKLAAENTNHGNPVSLVHPFSQMEDGFYRRIGRIYFRAECEDKDGNVAVAEDSYMFQPPLIDEPFPDLEVKYFLIQGPDDLVSGGDVVLAAMFKNNGVINVRADYRFDFGDGYCLDDVVDLPAGLGQIVMRKHQYLSSGEYCATASIDRCNLIKEKTPGNANNCKSLLIEIN